MPVEAESLEVLEKASVAPAQARAIVCAIEVVVGATGSAGLSAQKRKILPLAVAGAAE